MKAFAILPTITVFIASFSILRRQGNLGAKRNLFWSSLSTIAFGALAIVVTTISYKLMWLYMLINVIFAFILVPIMTFTINDFLPPATGKILWIRLFGIGLLSVAVTVVLFGILIFFTLAYNPMDPSPK
jgi:prepilin signal peptidase PulO-like enzyme (type II secretory pathway)